MILDLFLVVMKILGRIAQYLKNLGDSLGGIWIIEDRVPPYLYYYAGQIMEIIGWLYDVYIFIAEFDWDTMIERTEMWVMCRLGASPWDFIIFEDDFFGFLLYKAGLGVIEAKMASYNLLEWIRWKIIAWWSFLDDIIDDAERWLMSALGATPFEFLVFGTNFFAFLLYRLGLSMFDANMASSDLGGWIRYKIAVWWSFLDDIYYDPGGWIKEQIYAKYPKLMYFFDDPDEWFWRQFRYVVDSFIDLYLDWVIDTFSRVLNLIWQARLP